MSRRGLRDLLAKIHSYPTSLISFGTNTIHDLSTPVRLERAEYSHEIVPVPSARLLALVAESIMSPALPRMLNSVAPRALLETLRREFGDPFGSTAPDYCFCFRALAIVPSVTYFDRDVITLHGLTRSNGCPQRRVGSRPMHRTSLIEKGDSAAGIRTGSEGTSPRRTGSSSTNTERQPW